MAEPALGPIRIRDGGMLANPGLSHGMHPVRTAVNGAGNSSVAGDTFSHHPGVALQRNVAQIVIAMRAGKFRVR